MQPSNNENENLNTNWENLDRKKFYLFNGVFMLAIRAINYPAGLIKTRLQVQQNNQYKGMIDAYVKIFKREGPAAFYKGFATASVGIMPAQFSYITTLELVKSKFPFSQDVNSFFAGACASLASTTVVVPSEVISQRLMVQDGTTQARYKGGIDAAIQIVKKDSFFGLYRGFLSTVATYAPSSALFWGTYTTMKNRLCKYKWFNGQNEFFLTALCTASAACISSILTNPLDVAKTRIQVLGNVSGKRPRLIETIGELARKEGLRGLMRGCQARTFNVVPYTIMIMTGYEQVKKVSARRPPS